jgi:hypothetical protein
MYCKEKLQGASCEKLQFEAENRLVHQLQEQLEARSLRLGALTKRACSSGG